MLSMHGHRHSMKWTTSRVSRSSKVQPSKTATLNRYIGSLRAVSESLPSEKVEPPPSQMDEPPRAVMTVEQFRKYGYAMVDMICDYQTRLEDFPVTPPVQPGYLRPLLPDAAPAEPEPFEDVLKDIESKIYPGMTHWQSPRFFAFFDGNTSFPSILAEMLMAAVNNIGFSWAASPVSTELEAVMMDWLAKILELPPKYMSTSGQGGGVIQGSASEGVLVSMLAARARIMEGRPPEDALKLVAYASDQAHSSFQKGCMILGLHKRSVPTNAAGDWAMLPEALEQAIQADLAAGLVPFFVECTIGSTSSCAVDPLPALVGVRNKHGLWLHVDAAYAGTFAVLPDMRQQYFQGLEGADSFAFNPHKALLINFDCCAYWVGDQRPLKAALSLTPVFLQSLSGNTLDYKDWQLPLGRRFRSLKLFFVLRAYGVSGLRDFVRYKLTLAERFATWVAADERFEMAAPPRFGLITFRLKGASNEVNEALLQRINSGGRVWLTHTVMGGTYTIRMAIGQPLTRLHHVREAWEHVQQCASEQLSLSS